MCSNIQIKSENHQVLALDTLNSATDNSLKTHSSKPVHNSRNAFPDVYASRNERMFGPRRSV